MEIEMVLKAISSYSRTQQGVLLAGNRSPVGCPGPRSRGWGEEQGRAERLAGEERQRATAPPRLVCLPCSGLTPAHSAESTGRTPVLRESFSVRGYSALSSRRARVLSRKVATSLGHTVKTRSKLLKLPGKWGLCPSQNPQKAVIVWVGAPGS